MFDRYITLSYKQTYCSDPWTNAASDDQIIQNVAGYLSSHNLYFAALNIQKNADPEACQSCGCKTGKTIYVTTFDSDSLRARYSRIGFN